MVLNGLQAGCQSETISLDDLEDGGPGEDSGADGDTDTDVDSDVDTDTDTDADDEVALGPMVLWATSAGGALTDGSNHMVGLDNGSSVVSGYFTNRATFGAGEPNETILRSPPHDVTLDWHDLYVATYHDHGALAWARQYGAYDACTIGNISAHPDGSVALTGRYGKEIVFSVGEPDEITLSSAGVRNVYVAKYGPKGVLAWAAGTSTTGDSAYAEGEATTLLPDGSVAVTGVVSGGPVVFGQGEPNETELTALGKGDIFVATFGPNGALAWARQAGGIHNAYPVGIASFNDGSIMVTGSYYDRAIFGSGEENETELVPPVDGPRQEELAAFYLAKYNPDGTLAWARNLCKGYWRDRNRISDMEALADGSVLITGDYWVNVWFEFGTPQETQLHSFGHADVFIAKYHPDGVFAWAKSAGGGEYDSPGRITVLDDGAAFITGTFVDSAKFGKGEPNETVVVDNGLLDHAAFVAAYSPDGTFNWVGTTDYEVRDVSAILNHTLLVTGPFWGMDTFGPGQPNETVLESEGLSDIFLVKYQL